MESQAERKRFPDRSPMQADHDAIIIGTDSGTMAEVVQLPK
jgi:hypothetical protein